MFFQEELTSLLSAGKPFSSDLEGFKVKIFTAMRHFSTLVSNALA